jgi:hypothetical protein
VNTKLFFFKDKIMKSNSSMDEQREFLLEEAKLEFKMMGQMDEMIMDSDLSGESIGRVLKYLADRHLGVTLTEPKDKYEDSDH